MSNPLFWWLWSECSPLPIPNREVKPHIADDTALVCGKVGRRQSFIRAFQSGMLFFYVYRYTIKMFVKVILFNMNTLQRIKSVVPMDGYLLSVLFDDVKRVVYNVAEDIDSISAFGDLKTVEGLWPQV